MRLQRRFCRRQLASSSGQPRRGAWQPCSESAAAASGCWQAIGGCEAGAGVPVSQHSSGEQFRREMDYDLRD